MSGVTLLSLSFYFGRHEKKNILASLLGGPSWYCPPSIAHFLSAVVKVSTGDAHSFNMLSKILITFALLVTPAFSLPSGVGVAQRRANLAASLAKRADAAEISSTFQALTTSFNNAAPDLAAAVQGAGTDPDAIVAAVTPFLTDFDKSIKDATVNLALPQQRMMLDKRQAAPANLTQIAENIADAIVALINALGPLEDAIKQIPILGTLLGPLLTPLDADLAIILTGLGITLAGVLALVSDLLSALGGALSGLGFTSTLGALGQ